MKKGDTSHSHLQNKPHHQESQHKEKLSPFTKQILIVDDHPDIILTFKRGLEAENEYLVDVNMPKVNGFEFSEKI